MTWSISGHTKVYALLGNPVAHSLSPAIYNPLFREHGIDAVYVAFEVAAAEGPELVSTMRRLGLAGVNLTVPFKRDVIPHLDHVHPLAATLGAVNVVVARDDGLWGYNTDATGFCEGLRADLGDVITGARVAVLGAGGAGAAVGMGLAAAGAREVTWLNRTVGRAEDLVQRAATGGWDCQFRADVLTPERFAHHAPGADIVVQCTSGPGVARVAACDVSTLRQRAVWCDINYWMDDPPHVEDCRRAGIRVHTGLHMLVHQAVGAFALFTGRRADPVQISSRLR